METSPKWSCFDFSTFPSLSTSSARMQANQATFLLKQKFAANIFWVCFAVLVFFVDVGCEAIKSR